MVARLALVALVLLAALPGVALGQVERFPTGLNVSVLRPTAINVNWNITAAAGTAATSTIGLFQPFDPGVAAGACSTATAIGQINSTVAVPVRANGTGRAVETLVIPSTVAEKALRSGLNQFFYCRVFSGSFGVAANRVTCRQGSSAFAAFSIARVELFFENRRRETTIPLGTPDLKIFGDVSYNGSGIVRAVWEVAELGASGLASGRVNAPPTTFNTQVDPNVLPPAHLYRTLHTITQYVGFGDRMLLTIPPTPPLPTTQPGTYAVNLRFVEPAVGFEIPVVTYFVKSNEVTVRRQQIPVLAPSANSQLKRELFDLRWETTPGVAQYRVDVYPQETVAVPTAPGLFPSYRTNPVSDPTVFQRSPAELSGDRTDAVVSALVPGSVTAYRLRQPHLERLQTGMSYGWRVRGLDAQGNVVAESALHSFTITP
jgi:hypothetical protein